jgi:hypothetical protein
LSLVAEDEGSTPLPLPSARSVGSVPAPRFLFCFALPLSCKRNRKLTPLFSRSSALLRICSSEKHARKPFRIRSFKTRHLKAFRMRSYRKRGWGPPPLPSSGFSAPSSLVRGIPYRREKREKKKEGTMNRAPTFSYTLGTRYREQLCNREKSSGHENRD